MDLGLYEILIIAVVGFALVAPVATRVLDGLRGRHALRERRVGEDDMRLGALADGEAPVRSSTEEIGGRMLGQQSEPQPPSPKALRDARIRELERLYVADEISVEEYEAELDKVMRKEGQ